jgi:hypothetical protein
MDNSTEESYPDMRKRLYDRNKEFSKKDWKISTFKTDKEETEFQKWVADQAKKEAESKTQGMFSNYDPHDPFPDYDMRGFYKDLKAGKSRAKSAVNPQDGKVHGSDYYKTPYHESFSKESQWATKNAPSWVGDDKAGWKLMDSKGIVYKDETVPQQPMQQPTLTQQMPLQY